MYKIFTLSIQLCLFLFLLVVLTIQDFFAQSVSQTFTSSGTFTVPCNVTSITVECWGGGGGGGGDNSTNTSQNGAGGGGGGYCTATIVVTPGSSIAYTVGTAGAAGAAGASGGNGGNTTFSTVVGNGGSGGAFNGAGGAGGGGSGGTVTTGVTGGNGTTAGSSGAGGLAGNSVSGNGASRSTDGNGNPGTANTGGGGGGAYHTGAGTNSGGAGGTGKITITYTGANAGPDQNLAACATTATLAGNTALAGSTGTWSCITNCTGVSITTPTSANSGVTGLSPGTATTFRWTISNSGSGCATSTDDVIITANQGPGCYTYCSSTHTTGTTYYISNVTFGSINNSTTNTCGSMYCDYMSQSTTVTPGSSYTISVTAQAGGNSAYVYVWFDWDNTDGTLTNASPERFSVGSIPAGGVPTTISTSVSVPSTADLGLSMMRVNIMRFDDATDPCNPHASGYGETEDYSINVCDVDAGTISTTSTIICPVPGTKALSISGYTTSGTSIQWEESSDGTNWSNETGGTGGTTANYTTESLSAGTYYYRARVYSGTCSNYSSICTITVNTALCSPSLPTATGFETCDGTLTVDMTTGSANSVTNTASPNSGSRHASLTGLTGGGAGAMNGSFITAAQTFVPGRVYTVSVWGYLSGGAGCFSNVKLVKSATNTNAAMYAATGDDVILASTQLASTSYVYLTGTFSVETAEQKYVGIQLYTAGVVGCGGMNVYLDDFSITSTCTQCSNSTQDGDETGVDCGGTMCYSSSPAVGALSTTPVSLSFACGSSTSFNLCLASATGLIQWQQSSDGGTTWNDIHGANALSYSTTATSDMKYRAKVTSDGCGSTVYSSTATVTITGLSSKTWDGGAGTSNWLDANNWNPNGVPTSCNDVTLSTNVTVNGAASCHSLTISSGTLTLTTGNNNYLNIYGNFTNNGTVTQTTASNQQGIGFNGVGTTWGGTGTYNDFTVKIQDGCDMYMIDDATIAVIDATKTATKGTLSLGNNTLKLTNEFKQSGSVVHVNTGFLWIAITVSMTIDQSTLFPDFGTVFWDLSGNWTVSGGWNTIGGSGFYNMKQKNTGGTTTNNCQHRTRNDFTIESGTGTVAFGASTTYTLQCEGHFVNNDNDGTPFNAGLSTVTMLSETEAQDIKGTVGTTFYKLTINNSSSGVTQQQGVTVSNTFTLTDGPFYLNSLTATVTNAATTAIARNSGYVVSETNSATNPSILQWNIGATTGAHVFPFGSSAGSYIPVTFNNSGNVGNVSVSTRPSDPTTPNDNQPWPSSVTSMDGAGTNITSAADRWWEITSTVSNPLPSVDLTLSYLGTENSTTTSPTDTRGVQHWNGSCWDDGKNSGCGTVTSSSNNGVTTGVGSVAVTGITYFSPFIVVRTAAPLPVELLSFNAHLVKDIVQINWSTAIEINNDYFTIERSKDAENWEAIASVDGAGNSNRPIDYLSHDDNPYNGISFYRLRQTDYDGQYKYYNPVAVELRKKNEVSIDIYPNPASKGTVFIEISGYAAGEKAQLYLRNILGQSIYTESIVIDKENENIIPFRVEAFPQGIYFFEITSGKQNHIHKFILK